MTVYNVTKLNAVTDEIIDYGNNSAEDVKAITKGYKFNGLFYERKNSNWFFMVEEVNNFAW